MENSDKLGYIGFIPFIVGGAIPYALFNFRVNENSFEDKIFGIAGISILLIIVGGCSELGRKRPKLRHKIGKNDYALLFLIFLGSFCLSLFSILFTILPVPNLVHIFLTTILVLSGLYFLMTMLVNK